MPVTGTTNVSHSLEEVLIRFGGAITVTVRTKADGFPDALKAFDITQAEALPYWGAASDPNAANRWDDLCNLLYEILINRGDISGALE